MELFIDKIESPLGEMLLVTDNQGMVRALDFTNDTRQRARLFEPWTLVHQNSLRKLCP